jgi:bifunctional non-homologous end joining protein LigD
MLQDDIDRSESHAIRMILAWSPTCGNNIARVPNAEFSPMLASAGELPTGSGWAFEYKWDGMRAVAHIDRGKVRLFARSGAELTEGFPELATLAAGIDDAVLDGELIALDEAGTPSFVRLSQRIHVRQAQRARRLVSRLPVTYMIFDVLRWDGVDMRGRSYRQRRDVLEGLALTGPHWLVPPSLDDGQVALSAALDNGLEGVVAKRLSAPYRPGRRSEHWIKVKRADTVDLVVGGWRKMTRELGSLLVGEPAPDGRLRFRGRVGGGISQTAQRELLAVLRPLLTPGSPFVERLTGDDARGASWVRPEVVVEIKYAQITPDGRLRFPRFVRLRPDKSIGELLAAHPTVEKTPDPIRGSTPAPSR